MIWRSDDGRDTRQAVTSKVCWHAPQLGVLAVVDELFFFQLAVKRLNEETTAKQFFHEYENLRQIKLQLSVPVGGWKFETAAPGSLDHDTTFFKASESLWSQFEGLASALAYIHDQCALAHQDIKPSNILLYHNTDSPRLPALVAKIADFGLAVGLKDAVFWQPGTLEAKSAWKYDAPELRKLSKDTEEDLGAVFCELLTFLLGGSRGVGDFRTFITTTDTDNRLTSDEIGDARFDDGERVKPEVLTWLQRLNEGHHSSRFPVREVVPIIVQMLDEAARRPSASAVADYLLQTSTALFFDGCRLVQFTGWTNIPQPSRFDKLRSSIEKKARARIDWWPLQPVQYQCLSGYYKN
ncbi:hypothetical protein VTN77DRAFT_934 [Rasamsonia byssochlamydoides]|uniref:uncharacterized protein n=1 Tax=Rasamsonia byssochlamydoides TaxID=89139 RepID=UPI003744A80B